MQHGVFMFGCVEMDDAGAGPPAPTDRRYTQKQMWHAAMRMLDMGVKAEEFGFDTFWLTEHHFQYEGYEVIPNGVMFSAILGERTNRIKLNRNGSWKMLDPDGGPLRERRERGGDAAAGTEEPLPLAPEDALHTKP